MAEPVRRGKKWYLRVKDPSGRWVTRVSTARTKTEARRLAGDLERRYERQRLGLEVLPALANSETLDSLLAWWLENYSAGKPSHAKNENMVRRHLLGSDLGSLSLPQVSPGRIEVFLQAVARRLAPQTLNHLRGFISRAFNCARRAGRYTGANPTVDVQKRKTPQTLPEFFLRVDEVMPVVMPVLTALADEWRPLFATAIYTGLRKGELIGLRKADVDLDARRLTVARSYDHETTKGGRTEVIPIAEDLVPHLEDAIERSRSELLFPRPDGTMMDPGVQLQMVLRRALRSAGIVTGYVHKCRRKGCGHHQAAQDAEPRRCPKDKRRLWVTAECRPIRFHDLRHTTASLLMMAGAPLPAVARIMRHSDPRITMNTYGHLTPDYLRSEVNRLSFAAPPVPAPEPATAVGVASADRSPLVSSLLQGPSESHSAPPAAASEVEGFPVLTAERDIGFEPTTFSLGS